MCARYAYLACVGAKSRWKAPRNPRFLHMIDRAMLRESLATLPQTLDQTYDRILTTIDEKDCKYALRILQWLTFSARPLSAEEIAEIAAIDSARDLAFDRDEVLEDPLEALNICFSLLSVTTNKLKGNLRSAQYTIALAHYSVREYLVSDRIKQGKAKQYSMQELDCHNSIARGSLMYLLQMQHPLSEGILRTSALARYAAQFWSSHLQKTEDENEATSQLATSLLSVEKPACLTWVRLWDPDSPWKGPDLERNLKGVTTPLYYAAQSGLYVTTRLLLGRHAEVNAEGGHFGNALQAALIGGHNQVVKILLEKGAEVNAQGGHLGNALQAASYRDHEQIVETLLDRGAEVSAQGGHFGTALQAASSGGHKQVVETLLEKGTEVNTEGGYFGNALQAASRGGFEPVIKMLLDRGANVNAQSGEYGNSLQAASGGGYEQTVKLLLDQGAEVNAHGGHFGTALQAASSGGHKQVVKMLLKQGAQVNALGGHFGNALQASSSEGYEQIVEMLR